MYSRRLTSILAVLRREVRHGRPFLEFTFLNAFGNVFLFALPLLIARLLEPTIFGAYSLSIMVAYLFSALLLASTINPFVVKATEELREYRQIRKALSAWLVILAGGISLFAVISFVFAGPLTHFASVTATQLGLLFLAYLGIAIRRALEAVFVALGQKLESTFVEIISGAFAIIFLVMTHMTFGITLDRIFLILFVAPLVTLVVMSHRLDRSKIMPITIDRATVTELFGHMKWTLLGGAAMYLFNWGDNVVLRLFVPLHEIGSYNLGYQLFKGVVIMLGAVRVYFTPFLVQYIHEPAKIHHFLSHKRKRIMAAGALGIISAMAVLPFLVRTFYGAEYEATIPVALILIASTFFTLHRIFYEALLNAMKRYRFTQLTTVCFVALNIGLDVLFVMRFGIIGAAIATSITYIALAGSYEIHYRLRLKQELKELTGS